MHSSEVEPLKRGQLTRGAPSSDATMSVSRVMCPSAVLSFCTRMIRSTSCAWYWSMTGPATHCPNVKYDSKQAIEDADLLVGARGDGQGRRQLAPEDRDRRRGGAIWPGRRCVAAQPRASAGGPGPCAWPQRQDVQQDPYAANKPVRSKINVCEGKDTYKSVQEAGVHLWTCATHEVTHCLRSSALTLSRMM